MKIRLLIRNILVLIFLLFSITYLKAQDIEQNDINEYRKKLNIEINRISKTIDTLELELLFKKSLFDEVKNDSLKIDLNKQLVELQFKIDEARIKRYKVRTLLPSNDSLALSPIHIQKAKSAEIVELEEKIKYLKSIKKLDKKDENLLNKKEEELKKVNVDLLREQLEAYAINDKKSNTTIFPNRNIEPTSEETKKELDSIKRKVADKLSRFLIAEDSKAAFRNTKITYRATILNTNFTIPIVRFNTVKNDSIKDGDIQLFNSIGAGISYSWGRITNIRDSNGELIDTKFNSTFGLSLGVIFSAGSSTGSDQNVFAPIISANILDFQLGFGVELGTRQVDQKRGFFTIAYAIPLYKLSIGNYRIWKKDFIMNDVLEN